MSKLPSFSTTNSFTDKKLLVESRDGFPTVKSIIVDAAEVFPILKGTAMAEVAATHRYKRYSDIGAGGLEICKGVLLNEVDVELLGTTQQHVEGDITDHARLYESSCIGIDAAAKVDLPLVIFE